MLRNGNTKWMESTHPKRAVSINQMTAVNMNLLSIVPIVVVVRIVLITFRAKRSTEKAKKAAAIRTITFKNENQKQKKNVHVPA